MKLRFIICIVVILYLAQGTFGQSCDRVLCNMPDDLGQTSITATMTPLPPQSSSEIFVTSTPIHLDSNKAKGTPVSSESTQTEVTKEGFALYVPAVSFPSLQTTISSERLESVISGNLDEKLLLSESTVAQLVNQGISIHPSTRTIDDDLLLRQLWRERDLFTILPFDELRMDYRILWVDDRYIVDQLDSYSLLFQSGTPNFFPSRLSRVTFSGVTALTRGSIDVIDANGVEWLASGILPYVTAVDFFHTSNEVSIHPECPDVTTITDQLGGNNSFCSKEEHFEVFEILDLDIVELTGNHNNDFGYEPYRNTLRWYADHGVEIVGGGEILAEAQRPLSIDHNGNRVAILSCNDVGPYYALVNENPDFLGGVRPGAAPCEESWLEEVIPMLDSTHDVVVVSIQAEEHISYIPTDEQRFMFRKIANLGADFIVGTSAHIPQIFELFATNKGETALIHYGLGNLFFDQPWSANTRFFMDTLYIYEGKLLTVNLFPGVIEELARPRLMNMDERINFLFVMMVEQGGF